MQWRRPTSNKVDIESAVDVYRDTCQQQALVILECASSPSIYKQDRRGGRVSRSQDFMENLSSSHILHSLR